MSSLRSGKEIIICHSLGIISEFMEILRLLLTTEEGYICLRVSFAFYEMLGARLLNLDVFDELLALFLTYAL